ncbi:MAG: J domain-containing protein [Pseudanabaenaceae cyanobacterium SKYGB_i_bin29]|nr:J domain-containing protein [Pseudanabaenaceae cyanobacterium SKYG29]MDW8420758.1 J domain-containing protein [Pseudanabaenaceae cyanobacterium SKYGB_i_bin29]
MVAQVRTYKITKGIGRYDLDDYYAVLGVPLSSTAEALRQRYLTLAKQLHPDLVPQNPQAHQYLSRLVNPAYAVLQQERERSEYLDLLRLLAKRLMKQSVKDFTPQSEAAQRLIANPSISLYERLVTEIAAKQFQDLSKTWDYINCLSELNLVYLLLQEGFRPHSPQSAPAVRYEDFRTVKDTSKPSPPTAKQHIVRAQEHMKAELWTMALQELRAALQLEPQNSLCHALLGKVYLHQNVPGMAKVSFQQALKYDPQNPIALLGMKEVEKLKSKTQTKGKKDEGGFFGWLGNKK